jgi:GTP-binding protein LepA
MANQPLLIDLFSFCGGLSDREMSSQVLDSMDIEKRDAVSPLNLKV